MPPILPSLLSLGACGGETPRGALLFVSERDGAPTVWVQPSDGPARRLSSLPGATYPADPDPRGTHALVVSAVDDDAGHREQLWLVPLAGGTADGDPAAAPVALTPPAGRIRNPAWAPDGGWIAFESDAASYRDLYRVERDGTGLRRLTEAPFGSFEPAVSPDGARIAFGTSRDGNAELYVMGADGSDPRRLTDHPSDDTHPRWLPDGRIGWLATRGKPRVWTVAADGTDPRPVREPDGDAVDLEFVVSREGRLAIVVQRGPEIALEVVAPQGTALVDGPGPDEHPAWSPDGRWLVFTSSREGGQPDLWRVDADGRHPERLTTDPAPEWLPRWVPKP